MSALRIQLLGDFQLLQDGVPNTAINQPRLQALLAYLVLHRHAPQSRQRLSTMSESRDRRGLRSQFLTTRRVALRRRQVAMLVRYELRVRSVSRQEKQARQQ